MNQGILLAFLLLLVLSATFVHVGGILQCSHLVLLCILPGQEGTHFVCRLGDKGGLLAQTFPPVR